VSRAWLVRCLPYLGFPLPLFVFALGFAAVFVFVAGGGFAVAQGLQSSSSSMGVSGSAAGSAASAVVPSTVIGEVRNGVTGAPVGRALVRLNERAVLTDHDGKFRFDGNTSSNANLMVNKPGYYAGIEMQDSENVYLQGAQLGVPVVLRLYPEAVLTGTVVGPDGVPLARIAVVAERRYFDDTGHRWITVGQKQTDSHGNFRIPVQAGDFRIATRYSPLDRSTGEAVLPVTITSDGSPGASDAIRVRSGEDRHFELRPAVSPTHSVTIVAGFGGGGGGDFVRIGARASDGSVLQVASQRNGETGETKIQLPQGTFLLTAMRGNQETSEEAETRVTVPDHDISGVVLQFAPVPQIPVELVVDSSVTSDNSQTTAQNPSVTQFGLFLQSELEDSQQMNSQIRLMPKKDQSFAFQAPPGTYRLQGRDTGTWFIKGASYGDSDLLREALVVVPGAAGTPIRVTVSNATGSLVGTVNLNGSPSAAWIYLIPTGPSAQSVISLHAGSSGGFTAAHVPPGSYQVLAFERRHSANYRDAASLAPFSAYVHSVTVNAGDKPTLNLDAVPVAEVAP
jgi:hypothetical protein